MPWNKARASEIGRQSEHGGGSYFDLAALESSAGRSTGKFVGETPVRM